MKLFTGLTVVILASAALADTTSTTTSTTASSSSTATTAAAGQPATSTASLPATVKAATPRKIKVNYLQETDWDANSAKDGDGTLLSINQVGLSYQVNPNLTVAARAHFQTGYILKAEVAGEQKENAVSDLQWNDPFIQASIPTVAEFGGAKLSNLTRIYLPFGEIAQKESKHQGIWRNVLSLEKPVTDKVTLSTIFFSQLYNQSQSANFSKGKYKPNQLAYEILYQNVTVQTGKHVYLAQDFGVVGDWKHGYSDAGVASSRQFRSYLDTSITTDAIKNVSLTLGLNNQSAFADSKDEKAGNGEKFNDRSWQAYRLDESTWYFVLTASI